MKPTTAEHAITTGNISIESHDISAPTLSSFKPMRTSYNPIRRIMIIFFLSLRKMDPMAVYARPKIVDYLLKAKARIH